MCGFTGFWQRNASSHDRAEIVCSMANRIAHRGPDDSGVWLDEAAGLALAHRRLSIVDLSVAGHQPMLSGTGRYVLAFNGEIYNHLELRRRLEIANQAPAWRGHSDTETLVACIEAWGVESTLECIVGMFAFGLWDREERTLVLARDRAGEKPLYYGWQGENFLFGSELKSLRAHPSFNAAVDRGALALLLRHNYIPAPYSVYQDIFKLPPGTWLRLSEQSREVALTSYWSLTEIAERGVLDRFTGSDADAVAELEHLLGRAVKSQCFADVPLGALLSGGIDSSLITSLMQEHSSQPVRTFTIGFEEATHDEAMYARDVAAHLGTHHTEMRLSASDALALIPQLPSMYDEPFADSSQLPTYLVMKLARQHVSVALSGDAGDEFFAGYNRYTFLPTVWQTLGRMPRSLRKQMLNLAALAPNLVGELVGASQAADKIEKVKRLFATPANSIDDLYLATLSEWPNASSMVLGGFVPPNLLDVREDWPNILDPVARMMAIDGLTYLPDDILTKVDRASMAVSLETRAPFLDRDVMEFAWRLPMHMKLRGRTGKWILRQLLQRHLPPALVDRPKMGFSIPLDQWLRGPLRHWANDLLNENRLRREGYLRPDVISKTWNSHLSGEGNHGSRLWSILMFQAWLAEQSR